MLTQKLDETEGRLREQTELRTAQEGVVHSLEAQILSIKRHHENEVSIVKDLCDQRLQSSQSAQQRMGSGLVNNGSSFGQLSSHAQPAH